MTGRLGLRLTESDLDRLIAWRMATTTPTDEADETDPNRTPEQRAAEFIRLLAICLLPFAMVAACFLVALALA